MTQGIQVPVQLYVENLQKVVSDLRSQLSHLKVGSSDFKQLENIIKRIENEMDKLQARSAKPFINESQFSAAHKSVDKIEEDLNRISTAAGRIKFSSLELDASQRTQLKTFEDQITSLRARIKGLREETKQSFLNSESGKEWLVDHPGDASRTFEQITNRIRNAVERQNQAVQEAKATLEEYNRVVLAGQAAEKTAATKSTGKDPAALKTLLGKDFNTYFNESAKGAISFKSGENTRTLFQEWLVSNFSIDPHVVSNLVKQSAPQIAAALNDAESEIRKSLEKTIAAGKDANIKKGGATVQYDQERASLVALQTILGTANQTSKDYAITQEELSRAVETTGNNLAILQEAMAANVRTSPAWNSAIKDGKKNLNELSSVITKTNTSFLQQQRTLQNFNAIKMAIMNFMGFRQTISLVSRGTREALNHIRELDSVMNKISIVTNMSTSDLWNQVEAYSNLAQKYGTSIKGAYEVSQIYYQQGLKTNDVLTLTQETLKLSKISGLDYATTTDYMTTAIRGFKMEMSDASRVVDVYSNLAAHTAASSEEIAVAMSKTASSMESVGSTFEESSAMIATMVAVTRESATNIGSALKSIAARYGEMKKDPLALVDAEGDAMDYNKVDAALRSVGITLKDEQGQFRSMTDVVLELAEVWDQLESTQQRYIATQFAGNRQQSRFLALISNKDLLKQNLEYATNSEDTGDLQAIKALDSIEAKTEQVRVAYQQMYTTIGVEDLWGNLLDGTKNFINTLNGLPKLFGKIPIGAIAMIADIIKVIKDIGMKALSGLSGIWDTIFPTKIAEQKGSEFGEGFAKGVETALQKLTNVKLLQDTGKEVNKQIVTGSKKSEDDKTHDSVKNESTVKDIAKNAVEVSSEKVAINTEVKVDNAQISEAIAQLTSTFQNLNLSDILKAELDKIDFSAVDKSGQINAFYQNIINAAGENKQALYDKFVELGLIGVGQATEEGINAGKDGSVGAATALGQAILQALHDSINANSPSPTIIALFRNGVGDAIEIGLETSQEHVIKAATELGKTVPEALQIALEKGKKVNLNDYFEEGDAQTLLAKTAQITRNAASSRYSEAYRNYSNMLFEPDTTKAQLHHTEAEMDNALKVEDQMDNLIGRIARVQYEGIPTDVLVGTHNFDPQNLYAMAAWGGVVPSPSVAVRSAHDKPWMDYAAASMFMPRKYVDPQMGYTDLYRGDGYTRVIKHGSKTLEDAHESMASQPEISLRRVSDLVRYSRDATHLFNLRQVSSQLAAATRLPLDEEGYRQTESRNDSIVQSQINSLMSMLQYYMRHSNFSESTNLFDYNGRVRGAEETGKGAYSEALYRTIEGMTKADANSVSLNLDAVRKLFSQNLYESFRDLAKIDVPTKFQDADATSGIVDSSLEFISFLLKNPGYDWTESKPRGDVPFSELTGFLAPMGALSEEDYRFAFNQGLDPRRTFFYDSERATGPFSREAMAKYMIKNVPGIAFDENGPLLEGEYDNGFDLSRISKTLNQVDPDLWEITSLIDDITSFSSSPMLTPIMNSFKAAFSNIDFESEGATAQVEDLLRNFAVTLKYNIPELEGAGINVAHQIAAGIAIGFSQELADATTAASGCGKAVIEALNSGAGVASPSVFAKVTGENIIAGLVQGLKDANQSAMAAAAESGESVIEAIEKNATMDESTFNSWKQQMIKNIQDLSTLVASEAEKQEGIDFLNNLTLDQARAGLGGPMVAKALGLFREQTLQQGQELIPGVYSSPIEKAQWSYDNTRTRLANKYGYLTNQEDIDAARNELASAQARLKNRDQERQEKIDNSQIVKETKQKHAQESAEIFKKYEEKISEAIIPYDEQIREAKQIEAKYKEQQLKFYNKKGELKPNGGKKIDELNQQMAEELAKKGLKSSKDLEKDKAAEEDRLQREKQKELLELQEKQKDERIEAERKAGIEVDKTLNEQKKSDQKDIDKWSRKLTLADKGPKAAFSDEENAELEEKQKKIDELQGRKRTDEEQLKSKIASSSSVTQQRVDEAAGIERLAKENADRKAAEEAEKLRQEEEARKAAEEAERLRQEEEARKAAEEAERLKQEEARKAAENERLKQEAIARSKMVPEEKTPYKYESVEPVEPRDREAFVGQVASGEGIKPVKLATWDELKDASGFESQVQDLMAKIQTGFTGDAWANAIHGKTDEELELQAQTLSNPKRTGGNPIDFDVAFEALKRMREEATATLGAIKEVSEVSSETKEKTSTSTEQELAVLKQLKQAREQSDKAGAKEAFGSLKQMGVVSEKAVSINNATVDKYIQEREAMLATAQAAKETAAAEEEVAQAESSVAQAQEQVNASKQASDNSQSKTELETINENIAALERLAQGYQQLEASKNRSYTSNAAREEEEARINEKINSSKAILTANGVTGIDTLGSVRAALKGQQDRLPGLDQGASSLMSGYTMEDTSTDALKEKILAVTEQLTNAKVLSEESANSIRENLDNASPEKLKQELTELENKLQQVASESPGIGAKLKQAFTNGGISSFGAALSTISALFDKTTRGGQMAAGAITALGGAMRVVDGISKAMAGQNPWMALAMGVMAVINGISMFIESDEERLERLTKEAEEYTNKAKQAKSDAREIETSKKKIDELSEKRYESAEAAEAYQSAVDDLTSRFPRLIAGFDESGNAILDAAEMEKMLAETRQKSAKATYEAALKEYEANKEKERQAKKKVSDELSGITNDFATENWMISEGRAEAGATALSSFIRRKSSISNDTYDDIIRLYERQNTYGIDESNRGEFLQQLRISEANKNTGIGKILSQYDNLTNADDTVIEEILTQFEAAFGGKNAKAEDKQALHFLRGILTGNYSTEGIDTEFEGKTDIDSLWEKASALYYSVQTHNANNTLSSPEGKAAYNDMIATLNSLEQLGETRATEILSELNGEGGVTALLDAYYDSCADTLSDVTTIVSAGIRTLNQDSTYLNSNALTAMVTKAVTGNLDLSEMSRENADEFIKNADEYSEDVETWYRLLSDEQRTLFDKMYADPSKYTIEDIENAFKDTKGFDDIKTLLNSSSNAEQQETRRTQLVSNLKTKTNTLMTSEQKKSIKNGEVTTEDVQKYIIAQSDILTKYQNFIQDTNNSFSNSEQSLLNKAIDQVISLQSSGLDNQADEFGTAFLNLYSDIQTLEPQLQAALIQQFINNGVKTREGIQKTLDYIKGTEGYEKLNTDELEAAVSEWSRNIASSMQAYLADVQEKWKDQSKVFKNLNKSLNGGIDFTEIADVISTARSQGIELEDSDFEVNGDKFVLSDEAYDRYINAYFSSLKAKSDGILESLETSYAAVHGNSSLYDKDHILNSTEISQLQTVLGGDFDNWVTQTEEGARIILKDADQIDAFTKALETGRQNAVDATTEYNNWLARAQAYLNKTADWKKGDYSSLLETETDKSILELMRLSSNELRENGSLDVKAAVKQARAGTSSFLSDLITKGLDNINVDDYEGLPAEIRETIESDLKENGLFKVVRKYADTLGQSLADINKLVLQAYEKQNNIGKYSSDAIKDLQFINESQFTVTSSELESLAEKYDLNLGDLLEQGLINYSNELGEYVVNWTEIDSLTEDLYQVEGFKETIEESINTYLKKIASSINDALSGTLSLENKKELLKFAESHGIQLNTNDFTRTADGFRLSEKAAISLYNQVKKVDALAAQITFDKLKESLIATNDEYKTASSNLEHIRELNEKIIEANAKGDNTRANQYREELELAEKIYAIRSTSEDSSFNFMSGKIPGGQNNPINYYNNWATAFQKINEALKTRSVTHDRDTGKAIQHQGLIDYQDWYNIVMEMNNLASKTAPIILSDAIKLDGTLEAAAKLIEKGAAALTLDSNNQIKVALGDIADLGIDFKTGAKDLATNLDAAIHSYAQSQVDMLDSMIALLEVIVAMEALGDVDANNDMTISIPEIAFETEIDENGLEWITVFSEKYKTASETILNNFKQADGTYGELEQITVKGNKLSDILKADKDQLKEMGLTAQDMSLLMTNLIRIMNSDAFNDDDPWGSFLEVFAGMDWGDLVIGVNAGNHQILLSDEGSYSFDYTSDAAIAKLKRALPELEDLGNKQISQAVQEAINTKNAGKELNVKQNYMLRILTGDITVTVDDAGNVTSYIVDGIPYTGKDAMKNAVAASDIVKLDSDGEYEVSGGIAKGQMSIAGYEIEIESNGNGLITYKYGDYSGYSKEAAIRELFNSTHDGQEATTIDDEGHVQETPEYIEWKREVGLTVTSTISDIETGKAIDIQNNPEARASINELRKKTNKELEEELQPSGTNGKYVVKLDSGIMVTFDEADVTTDGHLDGEKIRAALNKQLGLDTALAGTISEGIKMAFQDLKIPLDNLKITAEKVTADGSIEVQPIDEAKGTITHLKVKAEQVDAEGNITGIDVTGVVEGEIDFKKGEVEKPTDEELNIGGMVNWDNTWTEPTIPNLTRIINWENKWTAPKATGNVGKNPNNGANYVPDAGNANGNIGLAKAQGTLMGELGPELVVSNGRYFVVGQDGPEIVDLAEDAIVFNHLQTKSLLEKGMSNGRGRAVTNEYNAVSYAKGNIDGGPAMASASSILGTLRQLRAQWQALAGMSASDLAKKGGGGGGGGGKTPFIKELERWYNWLQKIAQLEREINLEEAKRSKYATSFSRNGGDYARSQKTTLDNLKQEVAVQKNLNDEQEKYLKNRIEQANNDGSPWRLLYKFTDEGAFQYDKDGYAWLSELFGTDEHGKPKYTAEEQYNAIIAKDKRFADYMDYDESGKPLEKKGNDWYATALQNFTNFMDSDKEEFEGLVESVNEGKISVEKLEQQRNEILKEMEDNQIEVEQKVLKAVEESRQREIDELQKQRDAIEKGNRALIDGLNNQLQKEQDMYNSQQETDELAKLQRQLAILQRSGGSAASIADLQEQIADKQQSMYFDEQQKQIDALQEASDNELERLDHQIDIMQETLDYEKEHGLLWNEVYRVLDGSAEEIAGYIKDNTKEYWGASPTELAQKVRDDLFAIDKFKQLQVDGGMEALIAMYNDSKDDEAAEEEKKNTDEEEAAAAAAAGGDTSVDTSGGNNPTPASTQTKYKATLTGKTVTGKSFTVSGTGVGNNAAAAQRTALQYAANKVPKDASYTSMPAYEKVYATGGLVKQPTYALIGEEGEEGILNAAQTEYLRNKLMSSRPDSFVSAVDDFFASLDADKTALQAIANFNGALDNQASITIEHAAVNLQVDKLANDYDAKRAANTIMQEMLHIASKSQSNNSVGR